MLALCGGNWCARSAAQQQGPASITPPTLTLMHHSPRAGWTSTHHSPLSQRAETTTDVGRGNLMRHLPFHYAFGNKCSGEKEGEEERSADIGSDQPAFSEHIFVLRCAAKQAPEQSACPEPSADKADQGSFLSETENARLPLTLRATLMQRRPFQLEHGAHHLATPTSTRRKASSRRSLIHGAFARTRRSYQNPPPQLCQ